MYSVIMSPLGQMRILQQPEEEKICIHFFHKINCIWAYQRMETRAEKTSEKRI
jgi:hypothetical protein